MATNRVTFFACDNGDAVLIEAHGRTIMTDIYYRAGACDEDNEDVLDFGPNIRKACDDDRLNVFVLTHPDKDHLCGFGEIFHLGKPADRDNDPDEGDVKLIVDEIWCTSYSADPNYTTDASKPLIDEIKRRKKLSDTEEGKKDGNRLCIVTPDRVKRKLSDGIEWRALAPNADEARIPKAGEGEAQPSSNSSSLVIQWTITVDGKASTLLVAGDAPVEVWERLKKQCTSSDLEWNVLLAPHHCSRHSLGRKRFEGEKEIFEWSEDARSALAHPIGTSPYVVASSRKFGADHPPHPEARDRYRKILAGDGQVTDDVKKRFKCTAGEQGDKPEHIVFNFTSKGAAISSLGAPTVLVTPSSSGGGGYG